MKEEAKEIVQAVSETIKERASNPIIVTFIISWCVYNWNALFLLAFSKESITKRIDEASLQFQSIDSWLTPVVFAAAYSLLNKPLNLGLRKIMEKIDHLFIVIEHSKKKKGLELEKEREILRAENEMAYEGTKTQHEKYIQDMKEEITESKDREGILTLEIDALRKNKIDLEDSEKDLKNTNNNLKNEIKELTVKNSDSTIEIANLKNELVNALEKLKNVNSFNENITRDHSKLTDENKNLTKENTFLKQRISILENAIGALETKIEDYKNHTPFKNTIIEGIELTGARLSGLGGLGGIGEVDKEMNKKSTNSSAHSNKVKKN